MVKDGGDEEGKKKRSMKCQSSPTEVEMRTGADKESGRFVFLFNPDDQCYQNKKNAFAQDGTFKNLQN